jgi:riboflavin biosynthesis pyrimidine reductase
MRLIHRSVDDVAAPSASPVGASVDLHGLLELYGAGLPAHEPWLTANMVTSLDGRASIDDRSKGLSNDGDMDAFAVLRSLCDVVIVGAGTARAEHYKPATVRPALAAARAARGQTDVPRIAVISDSLDLDPSSALIQDPHTLVITHGSADVERRRELEAACTVIVLGDQAVDLGAAKTYLAAEGMPRMLCEGGPTLLASLAIADLVDELCLTVAPILAIAPGHPLLERLALASQSPTPMRLVHVLEDEGFLLLRHQRTTQMPGRSA